MDCRRVGCDGQMNDDNKEEVGLWSRRTLLICPKCKLCHNQNGVEARSHKVSSNILIWDTVCYIEVDESTVELKDSVVWHADDDFVWELWKNLVGA